MDPTTFVFLAIGTALVVVFVLLSMVAQVRYQRMIASLKDSDFFKGVYPVGFLVLDAVGFGFDTAVARERRRQTTVLNGKLYGEYYLRLNYAQKVSVALYVLPFGFLTYPLFGAPLCLLVGLCGAGLAWWYFDLQITDEMKVREEEITRDLSDVISKLALLVNAGMILTEAWDRVSRTGNSTIYREMRNAVSDMRDGGLSEEDAILEFGNRCMDQEVKKFSSTLVQNTSKGNRELVAYLRQQSDASWTMRRELARQKGEEASSKLMLPIAGMMIGVMVMVIVPIFGSLGI